MGFVKGNQESKGKGRPKGSKNLKTVLRAEQVMANADFNPVALLIELAKDSNTPTDQRVKIAVELSSLLNPKAKDPKPDDTAPPEPERTGLESVPTGELLAFTKKSPT